jgi:threonine dehydratase
MNHWCPPLSTILEAQRLLAPHLPVTSLVRASGLASGSVDVHLKLEIELPTGAFKPRGALYALTIHLRRGPVSEVTASSTGNHGAAVAWAAKALGIRATIFLPANPNPVKRKKIADLGARIVEIGGQDLAAAVLEARDYSNKPGVFFLNDATDPDLPAGPGTIGLEILSQLPDVASIYVPMGDTALVRGLGAAVKQSRPAVRVVGVQAERAPSYYLSWKAGRPVPTETCDTMADGLATRIPEAESVSVIRELVDEVILVSEEEMLRAIRLLYDRANIVAEPAGAAATAAYLKNSASMASAPSGPAVLLVTGGNITDSVRHEAGLPS